MTVSYEDLQKEHFWNDEYVPMTLTVLRHMLLTHYGWSADAIGTKGDNAHLKGYHRSRNWIKGSQYCTNRSYSVSETDGDAHGGDGNEIAAMDIVTDPASDALIYARLARGRALGHLPMLRELRLETGPSHVHIGWDRAHLHDDTHILYNVITGQIFEGTPMAQVSVLMPELKQGDENPDVKTAQDLLNLRGASLEVDGQFGPLTDAAVRDFQTRSNLTAVDGIVGRHTWTTLLAGHDVS